MEKLDLLSWRNIAYFVYACCALLVFDYVWRVVEMPFMTMALTGLGIAVAGFIALVLLLRRSS